MFGFYYIDFTEEEQSLLDEIRKKKAELQKEIQVSFSFAQCHPSAHLANDASANQQWERGAACISSCVLSGEFAGIVLFLETGLFRCTQQLKNDIAEVSAEIEAMDGIVDV